MGSVVSGLFGGNKDAKREAAKQRAEQRVAQDRQLSAAAAAEAREGGTRRNPRGRRLFADASASDLPSTVA